MGGRIPLVASSPPRLRPFRHIQQCSATGRSVQDDGMCGHNSRCGARWSAFEIPQPKSAPRLALPSPQGESKSSNRWTTSGEGRPLAPLGDGGGFGSKMLDASNSRTGSGSGQPQPKHALRSPLTPEAAKAEADRKADARTRKLCLRKAPRGHWPSHREVLCGESSPDVGQARAEMQSSIL